MGSTLFSLKADIIEAGRRIYNRNFVAANDGNISARIDERRVLITASGVSKGFMTSDDLIVVDNNGRVLEGVKKPSSEMFMHLGIYRDRPDVNGICHAHPPKATGFATAGIPLTQCVLPEVIVTLGGIPLAEYGTPGTEEFYKPILKYLKDYDAFLLQNHGALTIGPSVMTAYFRMETLEHFAHIASVALQLGRLHTLGQEDVQKLIALRENFGIKTQVSCEECERKDTGECRIHGMSRGESSPATSSSDQTGVTSSFVSSGMDREALVESITSAILKQLRG